MSNHRYEVDAAALNLRSAPKVDAKNRIDVLPQGHIVVRLADAGNGWWQVETIRHGLTLQGFAFAQYLRPAGTANPPGASGIAEVHLIRPKATLRSETSGRAYPLSEDGMPRRTGSQPSDKAKQIGQIVKWLAVEKSARYESVGATTYCNIYAYDYAFLCGAYVPRVWWTPRALIALANGDAVVPRYDDTVREMNANMLTDWFEDYGELFQWRREYDLTEFQNAANRGEVCILVAQRTELNQPGHICAVVPETAGYKAKRKGGKVVIPLQSQAGAENYRYGAVEWWTNKRYGKFGFWRRA